MSTTSNLRPPSILPNGKRNPEYTKWYNESKSGIESRQRYGNKPETKAKQKAKYKEQFPNGSKTCRICKSIYHLDDVLNRGWPMSGGFHCICDLCQ